MKTSYQKPDQSTSKGERVAPIPYYSRDSRIWKGDESTNAGSFAGGRHVDTYVYGCFSVVFSRQLAERPEGNCLVGCHFK